MQQTCDYERLRKSLRQIARQLGYVPERSNGIPEQVERLVSLSGAGCYSRARLLKLGTALVRTQPAHILAPCCPDYSHSGGRYNFQNLGGGVSLLATRHIDFLKRVAVVLPTARVTFLMADLEAEDADIRAAVRKERAEFQQLVEQSLHATRTAIQPSGWNAEMMTTFIPDLAMREKEIATWIHGNDGFRNRITTEAISRKEMYFRIKSRYHAGEMEQRTIRTAAQYVALGRYAAEHGMVICNHTTTNLAWYAETEAGIIHNPVAVY